MSKRDTVLRPPGLERPHQGPLIFAAQNQMELSNRRVAGSRLTLDVRTMRKGFALVCVLAALGHTARARQTDLNDGFTVSDELTRPLRYELAISPATPVIGDDIEIEFRITNVGERSVALCPKLWESYSFIGTKGVGGRTKGSEHGLALTRIPPQMTVSWKVKGTMPEVGAGEARLFGEFASDCSQLKAPESNSWSGYMMSPRSRVVIASPLAR